MGAGNSSEAHVDHEEEESDGLFPPMVLQLEDLLWPCTEAIDGGDGGSRPRPALAGSRPAPGCAVFLDEREVCRTTSLPSSVTRVRPRSLVSELRLQFHVKPGDEASETDDFGEEETVLAELVLPVHRLSRFGAPLYLSLWLGLREGCSLDFDSALTRAQDPEAPKVRLTLYKPADWPATFPSVQNGVDSILAPKSVKPNQRLPAPDVWGALTEESEQYSGCSGRPETQHRGPSLVEQINGLMHSLRLSNATVRALQQALFSAAGPPREETRPNFEASSPRPKLEASSPETVCLIERVQELEIALEAMRAEALASEDWRRAAEEEIRERDALANTQVAELNGLRRAEAEYAETLDAKVQEVRALEVLQQGYGRANAEEERSCQEIRQALNQQQLEMEQLRSMCRREIEEERQIAAECVAERLSKSTAEIAHLTRDRAAREEQEEHLEREAEALTALREDVERACRRQMASEQLRHDGQQEALEQHLFGLELMQCEREAAANATVEQAEQERLAFENEAVAALQEQAHIEAWAREQREALQDELHALMSSTEGSEDERRRWKDEHVEVQRMLGELQDFEAAQEVTARAAARAQEKQHQAHLISVEKMQRESMDMRGMAETQEEEAQRQLENLLAREEKQAEALRAKMEEEQKLNELQATANQRERTELQAVREEMRAAAGGVTSQEMELRRARAREAELLDELLAADSAQQAADEARIEQAQKERSLLQASAAVEELQSQQTEELQSLQERNESMKTLLEASNEASLQMARDAEELQSQQTEELQSLHERNESMKTLLDASNEASLQQARDAQASELKMRALEAQLEAARNELATQQQQFQDEVTSIFGADGPPGQSARAGRGAPKPLLSGKKDAEASGPGSPLQSGVLKEWKPVESPRIDAQPDEKAKTSARGWKAIRSNVQAQAAFEYSKPSISSVVKWHLEQKRAQGGGPPPAAG